MVWLIGVLFLAKDLSYVVLKMVIYSFLIDPLRLTSIILLKLLWDFRLK